MLNMLFIVYFEDVSSEKKNCVKNFRRDLRNVLNCVQFVKIPKSAKIYDLNMNLNFFPMSIFFFVFCS